MIFFLFYLTRRDYSRLGFIPAQAENMQLHQRRDTRSIQHTASQAVIRITTPPLKTIR